MTSEQQASAIEERDASAIQRLTVAIMKAIEQHGGWDVQRIMSSLGVAAGTIAAATSEPDKCLDRTIDIARRVANGSFLT